MSFRKWLNQKEFPNFRKTVLREEKMKLLCSYEWSKQETGYRTHIVTFISRKGTDVKDIKITSKNRPVVKPCCSGLPNGLPPLTASRILSLKLQSMKDDITMLYEKIVDIEQTAKWNTNTDYFLHWCFVSELQSSENTGDCRDINFPFNFTAQCKI